LQWLLAVGWLGLTRSLVRVTKSYSTNSSTEDLVMRKFCKCVDILWKYRTRRVVLQTDRLQTQGSLKRATKRDYTRRVVLQIDRLQTHGSLRREKKGRR
jgi:hypothetical protein